MVGANTGDRLAGSYPYLTMLATATCGWLMALQHQAAKVLLDEGSGDRAPVGLTSRQWAVLRELVGGRSNKEIAKILGIEEITVKVHLQAVFKRLQVSNRTQAATYAMQRGWFNNRSSRSDVSPS